jgi:hypothetical protein
MIGPIPADGQPLSDADCAAILRDYDLAPDDWLLDRFSFRGGTVTLNFRRQYVRPAQSRRTGKAATVALPPKGDTHVNVILGDYQIPFHEVKLHRLSCAYVRERQPRRIVLIGDIIDFPSVSRFPRNPYHDADVQKSLDAAYGVISDLRDACPDAEMVFLPGNHEERLQRYVIANAGELHGVHRVGEITPVLTIQHLLRLEELGVRWVADEFGEWPQSRIMLCPKFAAGHGWIVRRGAGNSVRAIIDKLGYSFIMGHVHTGAIIWRTTHAADGSHAMHCGVENGTMCQIRGGQGFASVPDWANLFHEIEVRADGSYLPPRQITYQDGRLFV